MAFLKSETELFGIADMSEIQERAVELEKVDYGVIIHINYHRVINGMRLYGGNDIHIVVGQGYEIEYINADVKPVPSEFYEIIKKQTITTEDA